MKTDTQDWNRRKMAASAARLIPIFSIGYGSYGLYRLGISIEESWQLFNIPHWGKQFIVDFAIGSQVDLIHALLCLIAGILMLLRKRSAYSLQLGAAFGFFGLMSAFSLAFMILLGPEGLLTGFENALRLGGREGQGLVYAGILVSLAWLFSLITLLLPKLRSQFNAGKWQIGLGFGIGLFVFLDGLFRTFFLVSQFP